MNVEKKAIFTTQTCLNYLLNNKCLLKERKLNKFVYITINKQVEAPFFEENIARLNFYNQLI